MFFPEKVYRCDCLSKDITYCLANQVYSLMGICQKINETDGDKIYCTRCGENDKHVVLSCRHHMPLVILKSLSSCNTLLEETKDCCLICIKRYLEKMYHILGHENFKKN